MMLLVNATIANRLLEYLKRINKPIPKKGGLNKSLPFSMRSFLFQLTNRLPNPAAGL